MKSLTLFFLLVAFSFTIAQKDATRGTAQYPSQKSSFSNKIYYGGGVGFNFLGNYFRISVEPMVGYKVTPKLSAGIKLMYEYVNDSRYATDVTSNNYGSSVFSRFRVIPQLYLHAEFAYYSYKYRTEFYEGDRDWVPFLLLGAGYSQQISKNTWAYAQALWDVIQDDKSPYDASDPWISIGVGVGF